MPLAVVTGATAGLGAEFARQLATAGYSLILVARDAERLAATAAALSRTPGIAVEALAADLATDDGIARVVTRLRAGDVDLLVNNAGMGSRGTLATAPAAVQETMLRLHVLAVNALTQAVLPSMLARGGGAIITVSSVASYLTSQGNVNYTATKAYQRVAAESLALELAGTGVYVQALCPGFTHTEFHQRAGVGTRHIPSALWMVPEQVVSASLAALQRRTPTVVIPGWYYRAIVTLLRFLPTWLRSRATGRYRRDKG